MVAALVVWKLDKVPTVAGGCALRIVVCDAEIKVLPAGGGSGAVGPLKLAGDAVEAAQPAAGDPLTSLGRDADLAVLAEWEGWTCHGSASAEGIRRFPVASISGDPSRSKR